MWAAFIRGGIAKSVLVKPREGVNCSDIKTHMCYHKTLVLMYHRSDGMESLTQKLTPESVQI